VRLPHGEANKCTIRFLHRHTDLGTCQAEQCSPVARAPACDPAPCACAYWHTMLDRGSCAGRRVWGCRAAGRCLCQALPCGTPATAQGMHRVPGAQGCCFMRGVGVPRAVCVYAAPLAMHIPCRPAPHTAAPAPTSLQAYPALCSGMLGPYRLPVRPDAPCTMQQRFKPGQYQGYCPPVQPPRCCAQRWLQPPRPDLANPNLH
jgi:hypothetical protein